jgi:NADH-quinone oxidoreductase subunit F
MPAIAEESRAAREEGAKFLFLAAPHRIIGDESGKVKAIEVVRTRLGEFDSSGRRKPISTSEIQRLDCDSVIYAIGENADSELPRASGFKLKDNGRIEVNRFTLETSKPRFYAGGDAITGASNVSGAMSYGKLAARSIDKALMEEDRWSSIQPQIQYVQTPPDEPSASGRHRGKEVEAAIRAKSEIEVVNGLTHEEALDEACRCLRCDLTVANVT